MFSRYLYSWMFVFLAVFLSVPVCAEDLYIGDVDNNSIVTIDINDHPTPATKRVISGAGTLLGFNDLWGIFVYNNEIFGTVDGQKRLVVFDVDANGNVAPKRKITGLDYPSGVSVSGGEIFVGDTFNGERGSGKVKVFNLDDSGAAVPKRTISCNFLDFSLSTIRSLVIYGSEIFVTDKEKICVFDINANSNVRPKRVIKHKDGNFVTPYGLDVDGKFVYVADAYNRIMLFPISTNGAVEPAATIKGGLTKLSSPYGLVVKDDYIYSSQYGDGKINVYKTTDNGDVAPQWQYSSADLARPVPMAVLRNGYVRPSEHQQSGVNVSLLSNTENATTDEVLQQTYHMPSNFELRAPVGAFTATVDSNGANGVFRFNSTSLNGTTSDIRLYKCYDTNGTSMAFGAYSTAIDPDTEGAWWLEDDDGNYLDQGAALTAGTNYWVNYVVKDNGIYDEDRTLGSIKDPAALGAMNGGGGCVMNPAAGFGLEWLALGFAALIGIVVRRKN
ncbi:hypothetical protein [Desulfovibrio sp. JC022]|uniref:hypothetical protein n=1 Tax=Desulfovibrio sp. JC022 TaxID=2593642 RepID=UPI0013D448F2|nr:hypothetical protein [Desulfovibrio sp. JC022]NDV21225.1 hypothetical protein [Desulfovibrio sp. JC022]